MTLLAVFIYSPLVGDCNLNIRISEMILVISLFYLILNRKLLLIQYYFEGCANTEIVSDTDQDIRSFERFFHYPKRAIIESLHHQITFRVTGYNPLLAFLFNGSYLF